MSDVINAVISAIAGVFDTVFGGLESVVTASSSFLGNLS